MAIKASNQITITDITDAYSVFIDNENHSFMADKDGYVTGSVISNIQAYCGTELVEIVVGTIKFYQNGVEVTGQNLHFAATVGGTSTARTITIGLKSGETSALLTSPMEIKVPLQIDNNAVEITKTITISAAKTGATGAGGAAGKGITSVVTYFQRTNTNSAPAAGTSSPWSTTMTAPDASNHYLWAFDYYTYTDNTHTNSTVRLASQYNDANKWYSGTTITGTSTTPTAFPSSGIANAVVNDQYLNTQTGNTYICTTGGNASTALWKYSGNIKGTPGTNGADAILLEISSNGPTVFKKNTDNVKLTPVVRVAGDAQTITAGSSAATVTIAGTTYYVRWYNGSDELTKVNIANSIIAEKSSSNYTGNLIIYGAYVENAALLECRLDTTAPSA